MLIAMRSIGLLLLALTLSTAGQSQPAGRDSAGQLLAAAVAAQQRHDLKAAIALYRKALALQPDMVEARANLGAALAEDGQLDAAIEEDKKALAAMPSNTSLRMNLGLAYYKKGEFSLAGEQFSRILAVRPMDIPAAVLMGYVDIKLDHPAAAIQLLGPLEPGNENNMDLEYVLGYAQVKAGDDAGGVPRLERMAQATHAVDAYVIAGSARLHKRQFHEAREDLEAAVKLNPNFPGLQTLVGQARDALGDQDAAMPAFEAAVKENPHDFMANLYLGTMWLKQRDLEKARPLLEEAVKLQPQAPMARFQMAKLNGLTGKYAEAAATLEDLEKADPGWLDPHVELATLYYKLHRPADGQREREIVAKIQAQQQKAGPKNSQ
ncbi:MAG TPA: tetratricopeptide repeat protein [Terracidiphilus sp.]|nr:tetratricopeptide repeat protein [Terracidiphilus sp.]